MSKGARRGLAKRRMSAFLREAESGYARIKEVSDEERSEQESYRPEQLNQYM
jgi:hypothetical protein